VSEELIGKKIGQYKILEEIGRGGMATVYRAHQSSINRDVAIKILPSQFARDPNFKKRFRREARAIAALEHVHILPLHDFGTENGYTYMAMRYIKGGTLTNLMGKNLPYERIIQLIGDIAKALDYAHSQGVIHRDIKPSNILIDNQGEALLTDFGIAKIVTDMPGGTRITTTGHVLGTPEYIAPEQAETGDIDGRSDIYSLGVVLYELLTGRPPYQAKTPLAVVLMHVNNEPPPTPRALKPDIPEPLERVVLKAMAKDPKDRYQTAGKMEQALKQALWEIKQPAGTAPLPAADGKTSPMGRSKGPLATQPSTRSVPAGSKPARGLILTGLLLLLLLVGALAFFLFGSGGQDNDSLPTTAPVAIIDEVPAPAETGAPTSGNGLNPTATPAAPTTAPAATAATAVAGATALLTPAATPTTTSAVTAPAGLPETSLAGTIAYPVFDGTEFAIYFGQADGSGTHFYQAAASQPAFSPDGSRIAFHSWRADARGLVTMDISGQNGRLVSNFPEDQLPAWTPDGQEIIFLSRRSGDGKSELIKVNSFDEVGQPALVAEGEYPSIALNGQLVFKGWGLTGLGLKLAPLTLSDVQPVTDLNEDTAPAPSPDGRQIAFMSRRDGNWEIYVVKADGAGLTRLTNDPADDGLPAWSPDGQVLAFASNRGGSWAVWAMTPAGIDPQPLFAMEGSPDGFVAGDSDASRGWTEERISWTK
jgi:tRNA A-37 threonylcarbamoyl transferase component Bud32